MTVHYLTIGDYYADFIPNLAERLWTEAHIEYAMPPEERNMSLVKALCSAGRQMDQLSGCQY